MTYFDPVAIHSPFVYGFENIKKAVCILRTKEISHQKTWTAIGKLFLGIIECIPLIGYLPAYLDRKNHNSTLHDRIKQRALHVDAEIRSKSFQIQKLYFDVFGNKPVSSLDSDTMAILDNSLPDLQIQQLLNDLKEFKETRLHNASGNEREFLDTLETKLKKSQEIALRIGCLAYSQNRDEVIMLKKDLMNILQKNISSLKDGESFLLPSGYLKSTLMTPSRLQPGHSIYIDVKKTGPNYELTTYNAGEGIHLHQTQMVGQKCQRKVEMSPIRAK